MIPQVELPLQEQWARKGRFLTQALIFSGALNIGLLTSFFYFTFRENKEAVTFELRPPKDNKSHILQPTNAEMLSQFAMMSYGELVEMLSNDEGVEAGYKKRDLALASLVAFHSIDINKILQGAPLQRRTLFFQRKEGPEQVELTVYPGLTEDQHRAVLHFIKTEKFPFTTQGLFFELKQSNKPHDVALLEAFYVTAEYTMLSTLLSRAGVPLPAGYVIELVTQGDWEILKQFTEEQKQAQDFSATRLKNLLASYIRCRSLLAAKILLQWDREFILKKFEDPELMTFIDLFPQKTDSLQLFLKEIMTSPRSDAIRKKAAEKFQIFDPQYQVQEGAAPVVQVQRSRVHVVQPGDNLWKIARKYKVSIEALRKANHLETDQLRPGKKLSIPG